jgi:hypothetical protein
VDVVVVTVIVDEFPELMVCGVNEIDTPVGPAAVRLTGSATPLTMLETTDAVVVAPDFIDAVLGEAVRAKSLLGGGGGAVRKRAMPEDQYIAAGKVAEKPWVAVDLRSSYPVCTVVVLGLVAMTSG